MLVEYVMHEISALFDSNRARLSISQLSLQQLDISSNSTLYKQ